MTQQVADTLNAAADLIETRGWTTGEGWQRLDTDPASELCLEGAIQAATGLRFAYSENDHMPDGVFAPLFACPAYQAVCEFLGREVPTAPSMDNEYDGFTGEPLYYWNDEEAKSAARVVEVLRATALIAAARERETAEAAR